MEPDTAEHVNKPLVVISTLLWRWFGDLSDNSGGRYEACAMVAICACRSVELHWQTSLIRVMDATLQTRDLTSFKAGLIRICTLNLFGAALRVGYSFMQARLTWKWRNKLTGLIHGAYFQRSTFYFIGEGGGVSGNKMTDAGAAALSIPAP
eukprot:SAG31_NODE_770_length_12217_cov_2.855174_1_plen_151_part_00